MDTITRFKNLVGIVDREVQGEQRYKLAQRLFEQLPDTTEFEDAPKMAISSSADQGPGGLKRMRSGRTLGTLMGDEPVKKPLDRKRAEKQFTKLINKFMRLE